MLYNDLKYLNVANEIEVLTTSELKNCYFQYTFLNWIISVIHGAELTKVGTHVAEYHSEGTMSQIFLLGPSFLVFDIKSKEGPLSKF